MTLDTSSLESSSVLTVSTAVPEPCSKVILEGRLPLIILPVSPTFTETVRASVLSPVRVRVKTTSSPSVTLPESASFASIDTWGNGMSVP